MREREREGGMIIFSDQILSIIGNCVYLYTNNKHLVWLRILYMTNVYVVLKVCAQVDYQKTK